MLLQQKRVFFLAAGLGTKKQDTRTLLLPWDAKIHHSLTLLFAQEVNMHKTLMRWLPWEAKKHGALTFIGCVDLRCGYVNT